MSEPDVPQHQHESLVTEDDGAWRCASCNRSGSPYTLARRQPCKPTSESERKISLQREMCEEALVTSGTSPRLVDAVLALPGFDDWIAQTGRDDIKNFVAWLADVEANGDCELEQRVVRLDLA